MLNAVQPPHAAAYQFRHRHIAQQLFCDLFRIAEARGGLLFSHAVLYHVGKHLVVIRDVLLYLTLRHLRETPAQQPQEFSSAHLQVLP